MPDLAAFHLACWANAWLAGAAGVDDVVDVLAADGRVHHGYAGDADGLAALDSPDAEDMTWVLTALRRRGADLFVAALPSPGQPVGLAGPADFNAEIFAGGSAVVACGSGLGLVPHVAGAGSQWAVRTAHPPAPPDLREADATLVRLMLDLTAAADDGWAGPDGQVLTPSDLRGSLRELQLPPTLSARARRLAERAVQCWVLADSALATPALHSPAGPGRGAVGPESLHGLLSAARTALSAVAASGRLESA